MNATINYAMFVDLLKDNNADHTEFSPPSANHRQADDNSPTQATTTTSENSRSRT